jgi:hypothetical protein
MHQNVPPNVQKHVAKARAAPMFERDSGVDQRCGKSKKIVSMRCWII